MRNIADQIKPICSKQVLNTLRWRFIELNPTDVAVAQVRRLRKLIPLKGINVLRHFDGFILKRDRV